MSISSEISRISGNITASLAAVANKGVTVPSGSTSDDLAGLIAQITSGGTGAISVVDTQDSHGGIVKTITGLDISDTTATASDVASGKYFYTANGTKTAGTATIGVDCPIFSVTLDQNYDISGITCNRTYSESFDYLGVDGGPCVAFKIRDDDGHPPQLYGGTFFKYNQQNGDMSYYLNANSITPVAEVTYHSNNTITWIMSPIAANDSSDLTVSGATVTAPAGYYESAATKTVASGTAGTPTATKGTVSNHSITVTPSVTNTTGYITGETKTGTAVTVNVTELESGTKSIVENGTGISVSGYSTVDVAVPTGPDCPTFNVVTNSDFSQVTSITCDKTFAECLAYWQNDQRGAMVSMTRGNDTYESAATAIAAISNAAVVYALSDFLPVSHLTIYYTPNGSIEYELDPYPPHDDSDLVVSGATVNVPAGVFLYDAAATVASGTAGTPTATKGTVSNHSVSITPSVTNTTGYITGGTQTGTAVTVSVSELESGTKSISSNGTGISVSGYSAVDVSVTPNLQAKAGIAPTTSSQTIQADSGYDGLSSVQVNAMPSGTAGTPTATKGTVSNHSVSITPSVTNTTGYITGGTKTGTAITVSASELVSGNKEITSNGTNIDVANYSTVSVAVPSGSSKNFQYAAERYEVNVGAYTATDLAITVSKAGTYKCYWTMDRNTTSGTSGSRLYNGDTALGSAHATWSNTNNTRIQGCEETLTFAANATITVRARSRNTSYYCGVSNFFIVEQ